MARCCITLQMTDVKSSHLATFIGASVDPGDIFEVWEYCPKGSLQVLLNKFICLVDFQKRNINKTQTQLFSYANFLQKSPKNLSKWTIYVCVLLILCS